MIFRRFLAAMCFSIMAAHPALAASPIGEWTVEDSTARVAIGPCGSNLCGKLAWTEDGVDLGVAVIMDMAPGDDRWIGTIYDPRDGQKYEGHLKMISDQEMRVDGCVAKVVCGGETWKRFTR